MIATGSTASSGQRRFQSASTRSIRSLATATDTRTLISNKAAEQATREIGMTETNSMPITREIYDAFQRVEFGRWNAVIPEDVLSNTPAGRDLQGLDTLKEFAGQFTDLAYRIDLVDEHLALGAN